MEQDRPIKEVLQRIAFECQESGATKWQVLKIIKALEGFEGSEQQLKRRAAEELSKLNPEAAKTFTSFEGMRVYTSAQKIEPFDRGNIIKSLLRETGISRHVAEKIGSEVEDKVKDLKIEYLNTQIIREMVNVKLLEYGHEPVHSQYARIGLPVYEVRKLLGEPHKMADEMMAEYNWLAEIPAQAREMHFEGAIHIFCPQDFSTKISCAAKFIQGKREDSALEAAKMDSLCSSALSLRGLNFALAGAQKITKKGLQEECESFGKTYALTGKKRFAELALFSAGEWQELPQKKGDAVRAANALLTSGSTHLDFYVSVDSKYQLKLLNKNALLPGLKIASSVKEQVTIFGPAVLTGSDGAVLQSVAVNLTKAAEMAAGREERLFERLSEIGKVISVLCEKKKAALRHRPYFQKWMEEETTSLVSLCGLAAAAISIDHANPSAVAEKIISSFQKEGFAVSENLDAEISRRFATTSGSLQEQAVLQEMGLKAKKSYGFIYAAQSAKEAETLISECPAVEIVQREAKRS